MPSVKELYQKLSDVKIDAESISLNTDTVESLLSTVQADIAIIKDDMTNGVLVNGTVNTYPVQGTTVTNSNFTSTTSATLASAVAGRQVLTVLNEGAGTLFINVGSSASTTLYQVRLLAGDYWEAPAGQQSLQHSGIFSSAGSTARVTQIS